MLSSLDKVSWDHQVESNPAHKEFSFSLLGKSFYIVGMHPKSSRLARQIPYPALVFNLHWQFEKLREMGTYSYIRNKIRKRESRTSKY